MWKDLIVEEVREEREAHAASLNYDLEAICRELREIQEEERKKGRTVIAAPQTPDQTEQRRSAA
jgi:hypothetical protein